MDVEYYDLAYFIMTNFVINILRYVDEWITIHIVLEYYLLLPTNYCLVLRYYLYKVISRIICIIIYLIWIIRYTNNSSIA